MCAHNLENFKPVCGQSPSNLFVFVQLPRKRDESNRLITPSGRHSIFFLFVFFCLFFCFLDWCYRTRKSLLRLPPWARSKTPGSISTWTTQQPLTVVPKVHHRSETLYMPTWVKTLQVDGLPRISRLCQALYMSRLQAPRCVLTSPTSDPHKH